MGRVAVLGGGISGLALAYSLRKKHDVTVFERSDRVGGLIQTLTKENFLFECGPRSLRPQVKTLELIEELGLQEEIIIPPKTARYLYRHQKLKKMHPLKLWRGILQDLVAPKGAEDETIFSFASRRFGKKIAEEFVDPLTLGIFAGDIHKLSMKSCFPTLYNWEKEYGSVIKGVWKRKKERGSAFVEKMLKVPLYSFKQGMETLPKALGRHVNVQFGWEVSKIKDREIIFSNGETQEFDAIFSTLPSHFFTDEIPFLSLTVVHLGYRQNVLPMQGFGYLIPTLEQEEVMGVVWDSSVFPQQNHFPEETRLTVMIRGEASEGVALEAVARQMGIQKMPDCIHVMHAKQAIPQYEVGHEERVKALREKFAPIHLCGYSYGGISVNDQLGRV